MLADPLTLASLSLGAFAIVTSIHSASVYRAADRRHTAADELSVDTQEKIEECHVWLSTARDMVIKAETMHMDAESMLKEATKERQLAQHLKDFAPDALQRTESTTENQK